MAGYLCSRCGLNNGRDNPLYACPMCEEPMSGYCGHCETHVTASSIGRSCWCSRGTYQLDASHAQRIGQEIQLLGRSDAPYPFGDCQDVELLAREELEEESLEEDLKDLESKELFQEIYDPKELQRIAAAVTLQRAFRQHRARARSRTPRQALSTSGTELAGSPRFSPSVPPPSPRSGQRGPPPVQLARIPSNLSISPSPSPSPPLSRTVSRERTPPPLQTQLDLTRLREATQHLRNALQDKAQRKRTQKELLRIHLTLVQVQLGAESATSLRQYFGEDALSATVAGELTYGDLVAIADAASQNVMANEGDPMSFLTTSNFAAPVSVIVLLINIGTTLRGLRNGDWTVAGLTDTGLRITHTGAAVTSAVSYFAETLAGVTSSGLTQAATIAQPVAAFAGAALNLLALIQESRNMHALRTIGSRMELLQRTSPEVAAALHQIPVLAFLRKKIKQKLFRRKLRSGISLGASTMGIAGGVLTGLVVVGAVNMWNPVGWCFIGVAALGGTGLGVYRGARYLHKKKKLARLREGNPNIPAWVRTTGEWYRFLTADLIVRSCSEDPSFDDDLKAVGRALAWILLGGDTEHDAAQGAVLKGYSGIMAWLKG